MKRYASSSEEIIDIEVIINFESGLASSLAAETCMIDIGDSIVSHALSCNFKLGNHYYSRKRYSYYVEFIVPDTTIGIKMVKMKFKADEHRGTAETKPRRRIIIKDIKVGNNEFQSPIEMIYQIDDMFTELSKGNIGAVFEFLN